MIVVVRCTTTYADILSRVYGSLAFHSISRTLSFMPLPTFVRLWFLPDLSHKPYLRKHPCPYLLFTWHHLMLLLSQQLCSFLPLKLLPMLIPFCRQLSLQQEWLLFTVHHGLDTPAPDDPPLQVLPLSLPQQRVHTPATLFIWISKLPPKLLKVADCWGLCSFLVQGAAFVPSYSWVSSGSYFLLMSINLSRNPSKVFRIWHPALRTGLFWWRCYWCVLMQTSVIWRWNIE